MIKSHHNVGGLCTTTWSNAPFQGACAFSAKGTDILRVADANFINELHSDDWYYKTSQAFAVFLLVKSVAVVGDDRRYEWVIPLRAVETINFMTARWAHLPLATVEWA